MSAVRVVGMEFMMTERIVLIVRMILFVMTVDVVMSKPSSAPGMILFVEQQAVV